MAKKLIIDCSTGERRQVALTPEEEEALLAARAEAQAAEAAPQPPTMEERLAALEAIERERILEVL